MTRADLVSAITSYEATSDEERDFVARFLSLLEHPRCFHRDHLPGHITGSAWIVNEQHTRTLMVHHGFLKRWLQPGGHAEGEENIFSVALREAREETGVAIFTIPSRALFDIDIHRIPARKDFPDHDHYDIRFLFEADETTPLKISDESTDLKWVGMDMLETFTKEKSVLRMRNKSISK